MRYSDYITPPLARRERVEIRSPTRHVLLATNIPFDLRLPSLCAAALLLGEDGKELVVEFETDGVVRGEG